MSEDIYAGLNEDSEPEQDVDDPDIVKEFSGISGSLGSSPVKSSQPQPQTSKTSQDVPAQSSQESEIQRNKDGLYCCPFCPKKKYKTLRGFEKHKLDKHSQQNVEAVETAAAAPVTAGPIYKCVKCSKAFKTSGGMMNHIAGHKIEELNQRKPKPSDFCDLKMNTAREIIEEMLEEPSYGEMSLPKVEFLSALQNCESAEWLEIVTCLSSTILSLACDRDKRLPLNQYEKSQEKFNTYLNDTATFNALTSKFRCLGPNEISTDLAGRLLSRFSFKLMDKIQCWIASVMKGNADEIFEEEEEFIMDPVEKEAFSKNLGEIFRGFYKKGLRSSSTHWQSQSECLKETFVLGHKPISSSTYLDKTNWFSGERNSIVPSDKAISFFMGVEKILRTSAATNLPTTQDVIQKILLCVDSLNVWYFLTNDYFSEEASFLFMRDIILSYVTASTRFTTQRINRMREKDVRASVVRLREHLNKNFIEKSSEQGTEGID